MSRPKNDRKFQSKSGKTFQDLDTKGFVRAIAARLEGRIWCNAVGAQDSLPADPFKRAGRAKLVGGEKWPERLQPRHSYAPLRSCPENSTGTGISPRPRLGGRIDGLRQRLIDAVAEIDSLPLRENRGAKLEQQKRGRCRRSAGRVLGCPSADDLDRRRGVPFAVPGSECVIPAEATGLAGRVARLPTARMRRERPGGAVGSRAPEPDGLYRSRPRPGGRA